MQITRRAFLYSLPLSARAACVSDGPRLVVQIDDVSPSYRRGPAMVSKQQAIVATLGPGDGFTDIGLGGRFTPDCVKIQCLMPVAPPQLFAKVQRPRDLVENQQRLERVWARVDEQRKSVAGFLAGPRHIQGPTPLFETLDYVSRQMMRSDASQKWLVIFSDLVHDNAGRTSGYPPAETHPRFDGVNVFALFVPWKSDFSRRDGAWREWFFACGACDFAMLDSAQSQIAAVSAANFRSQGSPAAFLKIRKRGYMKTPIHHLSIQTVAAVVLAGCCPAQSPDAAAPDSSAAGDLARYIREEQSRHVRLSTGIYAHECFTDENYLAFRSAHTAANIAQTARRSARFRVVAAAIARLPSDRREAALAQAARIAHPTWAELGHITPDGSGQTEAGAAAERDISTAVVAAAREIIAEIRAPGAKI